MNNFVVEEHLYAITAEKLFTFYTDCFNVLIKMFLAAICISSTLLGCYICLWGLT